MKTLNRHIFKNLTEVTNIDTSKKIRTSNEAISNGYDAQESILKKISLGEHVRDIDIIISTKDAGIANRMKSLASAVRLSMAYGKEFGIFWDTTINIKNQDNSPHRPKSKFSDIFSNNFEVRDIGKYPAKKRLLYHSWRLQTFEQDNIPAGLSPHKCKLAPDGSAIDFAYDKIPDDIMFEYSNIFKIFQLKESIYEKIDLFSKKHFHKKTISVHMRTYNDKAGAKGKKTGVYSFELDKFIQVMSHYKEQYSDCNFFVCSDCDETIDKVKDIFGDCIITFDSEYKTTEEDVIDLYLLSKNNIIIGTKSSTFTEVAWWLSGCEMGVVTL